MAHSLTSGIRLSGVLEATASRLIFCAVAMSMSVVRPRLSQI